MDCKCLDIMYFAVNVQNVFHVDVNIGYNRMVPAAMHIAHVTAEWLEFMNSKFLKGYFIAG